MGLGGEFAAAAEGAQGAEDEADEDERDEDEDEGKAARAVLAFVVVLAEYVADLFRWNDALKNRGTAAVAEVKRLV